MTTTQQGNPAPVLCPECRSLSFVDDTAAHWTEVDPDSRSCECGFSFHASSWACPSCDGHTVDTDNGCTVCTTCGWSG